MQDWEIKMKKEHYEKYEKMAQALGLGILLNKIPFTKQQVKQAITDGDEHLNTLRLSSWDGVYIQPLFQAAKIPYSLSNQVCVLKHVARYHYIKD